MPKSDIYKLMDEFCSVAPEAFTVYWAKHPKWTTHPLNEKVKSILFLGQNSFEFVFGKFLRAQHNHVWE